MLLKPAITKNRRRKILREQFYEFNANSPHLNSIAAEKLLGQTGWHNNH
jgi:hypothetical protein